jgi:hypothetical protein
MSVTVGSGGTPIEVARALKVNGWIEAPGSQALWTKNGGTPCHWADALLVMAAQAPLPEKPARHWHLWGTVAAVTGSIGVAIPIFMDKVDMVPANWRAPMTVGLGAFSAFLLDFYRRAKANAAAEDKPEVSAVKR